MKNKKISDNSGFTLLEVMIASGIMAMTLSLIFGSLISVMVVGQLAESRAEASVALTSVMEDLRNTNSDDLLIYECPQFSGIGYANKITVEYIQNDGTAIALPFEGEMAQSLPNPLTLEVEISWAEDDGRVYTQESTMMREL